MATHIHQAHLAFPGSALGCKHGEPTQGTKAATAGSWFGGSPVPTVSAGKCLNKKRVISPANPMGNIDKYEYMISFKKNKYCMLKKRKWCEKSSVGCIVLLVTFLTLVILDLPLFGKRWCSSDRISSPKRGWTKKTTSLILPRES